MDAYRSISQERVVSGSVLAGVIKGVSVAAVTVVTAIWFAGTEDLTRPEGVALGASPDAVPNLGVDAKTGDDFGRSWHHRGFS